MAEKRTLRVRAIVSRWFTALAIIAVVTGGGGAWATYTGYVDPGTMTQQRTEEVARITTTVNHAATVTRENSVFPVGTRLQNRPTYFTNISPVLDGEVTLTQQGIQNASVELTAVLRLQSTSEDTTFWSEQRPLNATSTTAVSGEAVSLGFSLNISRTATQLAQITEELGSPGETGIVILVQADITGVTGDVPVERTVTRRLQIGLNSDTYSIQSGEPDPTVIEQTQTVTAPREYGPVRLFGGPTALLIGLSGLVVLVSGKVNNWFNLNDHEQRRLTFLTDRAQFDEWIVSVRLPDDNRPVARADSLADLVDLAIDTEGAVVEDPVDGSFIVVSEEYRYVYQPPDPVPASTLSHPSPTNDEATDDDDAVSDNESGSNQGEPADSQDSVRIEDETTPEDE